jgi:hypothetical protein
VNARPPEESLDRAAEELYGLPPGDFTRARDELAGRLRKDGKREEAQAVKALRKPTLAAWALNQLGRHRRKDVERLLEAGRKLQKAQEDLVGGGEVSAFQAAAAKERELVAELTREAAALAAKTGAKPAASLEEKIGATLRAAALDEETAVDLAAGRLVREREAVGGFGEATVQAGAPPKRPQEKRPQEKRPQEKRPQEKRPQQKRPQQKRAAADAKRKRELAAARASEKEARRSLEAASKTAARAAGRADDARKKADDADRRADDARKKAADANRRAEEASEELDEARRREKAAGSEHKRAARALSSAEAKGARRAGAPQKP